MMLSIIIPTYNERENIVPLVSRLERALETEHEIIFVDDNSPDATSEAVQALMGRNPGIRLVRRQGKKGLTSAVVAGAEAARGDRLVVMDADLSHPPESVPALASALEREDLVVGSRLIEGGGVESWPFHRRLISKGADLMARLVLGIRCSDPLSGFFAIRKSVLMRTKLRTKGYKLLLNILADNRSIRVAEVPYVFHDRFAGKTKLGTLEILNFLLDLIRIRMAPAS